MAKLKIIDVPHMHKMWDNELNSELPEQVSVQSADKKHWKCPECGYTWITSPKARFISSGQCPCHESNKVIKKGVNDVLTRVKGLSELLDENNDFEKIFTQGLDSSMPVNLKCDECGRRWSATLRAQIRKNTNGGYIAAKCPHYNTEKRKKEEVPFCTEVDGIYRFWDDNNPFDPAKTKSNSTQKVHFICKNCNYDWTTEIRAQARGSGKCKCCELQLVTKKGFTDVFTLIPESRRYYDFDKNKDIDIYSIPIRDTKTLIDWKCPDCNRQWQSPLATRVKGKKGSYSFSGCQSCYLHDKSRITSVASVPKLVKYWNFKKNKELDINLTSAYAEVPANWICDICGYEWVALIKSRMNGDDSCPFCEGTHKPVIKGKNDVLTICPELASIYDFEYNEKNGIDIYTLPPSSSVTAHFSCKKCGNQWDSVINIRVKKINGAYIFVDCPQCSNKLFRKTPYSEEFPEWVKMYREDLNNIPLDSIRGKKAIFDIYYHWDCLVCGETFEATLNSMKVSYKTGTKGCPYCSRKKLRAGESFAELHPEFLQEYDPDNTFDPYKVFANSKEEVGWICNTCGYKWTASFALRHVGGGNCPVCNRTAVIPDINSFAAVYPDHVKYWSDKNTRKPNEVFHNSSEWFRFICPTCGNDYGSYIKDFVSEDNNCPYCNDTKVLPGFNSFADKHPDLLEEMDPIANLLLPVSPYEVLDSSTTKFWWVCKKDPKHKYYMSPKTKLMFIKRHREPCLYCRGQRRKLQHLIDRNE